SSSGAPRTPTRPRRGEGRRNRQSTRRASRSCSSRSDAAPPELSEDTACRVEHGPQVDRIRVDDAMGGVAGKERSKEVPLDALHRIDDGIADLRIGKPSLQVDGGQVEAFVLQRED